MHTDEIPQYFVMTVREIKAIVSSITVSNYPSLHTMPSLLPLNHLSLTCVVALALTLFSTKFNLKLNNVQSL
jgi:hypothetical protein